jgi:dipeptidyl aminopeptidase/acylaminoacyl peptidase
MTSLALALALALQQPADRAPSSIPGMSAVPGIPTLLQSGVPAVPADLLARLAQYQNARGARLLDATADGSAVLVATRFGSTNQLHLVERPLGMREQVTFFDEPVGSGFFQPGDPRTVWLRRDAGGAEAYQGYRLDRRTGKAELFTDGKSRHDQLTVSRDGAWLAWSGTGRNGKDADVYVAPAARPREARRVVEEAGSWSPAEFSPDGRSLLVIQFRSADDADLHLVDLASGARRQLTPREGRGSVRGAAFAAGGQGVWLVTDRWSDWNELYLLDLARPEAPPRPFTRSIRWGVEHLAVAADGSRLAVSVNADGLSRLYLLEPRTGRLAPAEVPPGVIADLLIPVGKPGTLFLGLGSARSASDVWQLDLRTRKLTRWTRSEVGGIDPERLVEPELVRYPSSDGIKVPAFLYRPPAAAHPGRRPVVIVWHGGPEAQSRPIFAPLYQFLAVELGLAVLLPNVRGSDGYGKAFLAMDDGVKRERALDDVGATLDFVAGDPGLDRERVAVYGGSYGGYMVLASLAFHAGRIRAGVDVVGISSLASFLENTQPYRRDLRRAEYGDERIPAVREVMDRISPLFHAGRIDARLFVQQGRNDPRVPQSEAEQIVAAVQARGREVWYLLALNEGHGFAKKENRDFAQASAVLFLKQALVD